MSLDRVHPMPPRPPVVSVIIAVYDVEPYLAECLDSVLGQTYASLEILLVDDGSTDASPAICDTYAAQDPRVRSIHQRNAGVSAARNVGLAAATGEFVTFIDADDWCSPTFVERLMSALAAHPGAGIALSSFARVPGSPYAAPVVPSGVLTASESIRHFAGPHHTLFAVLWAKVYRQDVLEGAVFPEGRLHEDEFTTYRFLLRAPAVLVPEPLYLYRQRSTGITHTALTTERLLDALEAADQQVAAFHAVGEQSAAAWATGQALRKRMLLVGMLRAEGQHQKAQRQADLLRETARAPLSSEEPIALRALGRLARTNPTAAAQAFAFVERLRGLTRPARPVAG